MRLCRTDEWEKVHWNICKLREEKFGPRHQKTLEARMEYLHLTGKEEEALKQETVEAAEQVHEDTGELSQEFESGIDEIEVSEVSEQPEKEDVEPPDSVPITDIKVPHHEP